MSKSRELISGAAWARYGLAAVLFGTALAARFALIGVLPATGFPFLTFFPAVLLAAWLCGLVPGLLTAGASIAAAWFYFMRVPGQPTQQADLIALAFFGLVLVVDCLVLHVMNARKAQVLAREHELQALTANSPDVLTRFDRGLRHVFVNAAVERITGRPRESFLHRTNRELGMPAPLCDQWEAALRGVFDTGEPATLEFAFDTEAGKRYYAAQLVPERDDHGQVRYVLGVTRDVTEQVQHELLLQQEDRRKDEFLAVLAHELRNPLAPVRTGLTVLRIGDAYEADSRESRTIAMMERQVAHLVRLVDDLLDVSRIRQGKIALQRERLDLRDVLHQAAESCRPALDAKGQRLAIEAGEQPLPVDGDRTRLAQVVSNLLTNASRYSGDTSPVLLKAGAQGIDAVVEVVDQGIGIAAEDLPKVWALFGQVSDGQGQAQGGLGIGLSLVRKLVELHGGTVQAASGGAGQGSTFTVRLPLSTGSEPGA